MGYYSGEPGQWDEGTIDKFMQCGICEWADDIELDVVYPNYGPAIYTFTCPDCGKDNEGEIDL